MVSINPAVKTSATQYYVLVHHLDRECREQQYLVSTSIYYVDWKQNNKKMRAELGDNCFYVYEDGLREKCKKEDRIYFYDHKNNKCSASLKNLYFLVDKQKDAGEDAFNHLVSEEEQIICPSESEHYGYLRYKNWQSSNICTSIARWDA